MNPLQPLSNIFNDILGLERLLKLAQNLSLVVSNALVSGFGYGFGVGVEGWSDWIGWGGMSDLKEVEMIEVVRRVEGAKGHFVLARKFFRLLKWTDCFSLAQSTYRVYDASRPAKESLFAVSISDSDKEDQRFMDIYVMLVILKWSLLGLYYLLEMATITNALSLTSFEWADALILESYKFWTYGLGMSILVGLFELFMPAELKHQQPPPPPPQQADKKPKKHEIEHQSLSEKESEKTKPANKTEPFSDTIDTPDTSEDENASLQSTTATATATASTPASKPPKPTSPIPPQTPMKILAQLTIDSLDILSPSSALGWIPVPPVWVGAAGAVSAVISLVGVWGRVNGRRS